MERIRQIEKNRSPYVGFCFGRIFALVHARRF